YLDGVLYADSGAVLPTGFNVDSINNEPFSIGAAVYWGQGFFFRGNIDQVAVYSRALTQGEISSVMDFGVDNSETALVAAYSFDNGDAADDSGNNNVGTLSGDTVTSPGVQLKTRGLVFDGSGDYITCANEANFDFGTGDFTMSAWIKVAADNVAGDRTVIGKNIGHQAGGQYTGYRLAFTWGDILKFEVNDGSSTYTVSGTGVLNKDQWYYVTAQRSATVLRIYLDGVLYADSGAVLPTGFNVDSINNEPFSIGAAVYWGQGFFFNGNIDAVSVYNKALSRSDIYAGMNFGADIADAALVAFYSFDNGDAVDDSGNNNDGTITNALVVEGIRWGGHDELDIMCEKLGITTIKTLPASGTLNLTAADSVTVADLSGVVLDDSDLTIGSHAAYATAMSDGLAAGTGPYVASGIQPFRLKYFFNEFNIGGWYNFEMFEYVSAHGFNSIVTYNSSAADWSHLPAGTVFAGWLGFDYNAWMSSNGYTAGRWDQLASRSSLEASFLTENRFPFEADHEIYMIDLESPAIPFDPVKLRIQSWYPASGTPAEQAQFEADYYNGFADAELATIDTAHTQGWTDVGIYGWQPWARSWYLSNVDETLMQQRWDLYGKAIASEVDLLYPSVYAFYWSNQNAAYMLANIDKNIEYANQLPAADSKKTRPYFWNLLHGGGGGWRWYRGQPLRGEDIRAASLMNFFTGADGLVMWSWTGTDNHNIAPAPVAGGTVIAADTFPASLEGGGAATVARYDALYVLEVTATDLVRFQIINKAVNCPWDLDAVWHFDTATNTYVLDSADDGDYQYPVYTMDRTTLQSYLREPLAPVAAQIEGVALVKLLEYTLAYGKPCIDVSAVDQWSQTLPIIRRVKFGPYHVIATYDPNWNSSGYSPATITLNDFAGIAGLTVNVIADSQTRIFVVQE
ncbi:MAG: LamG domain-containing protein, partial [Victivallaceae bacterium]|nr:LamG domain-containing protein [Victivallaceae bacterium]